MPYWQRTISIAKKTLPTVPNQDFFSGHNVYSQKLVSMHQQMGYYLGSPLFVKYINRKHIKSVTSECSTQTIINFLTIRENILVKVSCIR
jgi:hypothetical protein